jgi:nitrite reductase (NO-forming)
VQITTLSRERGAPPNRAADRLVALASIAVAAAFLAASLAAFLLPAADRRGLWLPLHLALAGAATSAIAGVLPFFVAAFAAAQPARAAVRGASLVAVALGALSVAAGVVAPEPALAVAGGIAFVAGIGLTALAAIQPLRRALGPSRGLVVRGYLVAMAFVGTGALLATLLEAGWPPVADAWARLKPAHAWLNVVGFVSLVIATTLMHFYPTVIGARISGHWSGRLTITATALGPALVAIGYAAAAEGIARAGAIATMAGAVGLAIYVADRWRHRATWTTDPEWHRFVIGGLTSAVGWYVAGIAIVGGRVLGAGADPSGWRIDLAAVPLVAGWAGVAVVASASHLLPSVGPGDQAAHARQRTVLGTAGTARLVALDAGLLLWFLGVVTEADAVLTVGAVVTGIAFAATLALLAGAILVGARSRPRPTR